MALTQETISRKHKKELAKLRGGRGALVSKILLGIILLLILGGVYIATMGDTTGSQGFISAKGQLVGRGLDWSEELVERQESYRNWLGRYAFSFEASFFDRISSVLFHSAGALGGERKNLSFFQSIYLFLHFAVLRVSFLLLASWKVWVLAILWAVWNARNAWQPYHAKDLLGETGNGRLYYSGIRAALEDIDARGAPGLQVTGLASPGAVPREQVAKTELGKLLNDWGADNGTNTALAAILLHYDKIPAYIATKEEQAKLDAVFASASLADNAAAILKAALQIHRYFVEGNRQAHNAEALKLPADHKLSCVEYAELLSAGFRRVLTPYLQEQIGRVSAKQIATIILANEAGKVLTYAFEGGRWLRRSNFPQLNARAVLHSIPDFSREYDSIERQLVRRAIVYGSRRSVFAPVRFPVDLSDDSRATRQWMELVLACPHELPNVVDEVELVALVTEANRAWDKAFFEAVDAHETQATFSTPSNLFLTPLKDVLKIARRVIDAQVLKRVDELAVLVSQQQKLDFISQDIQGENNEKQTRGVQDKVLAPLTAAEMKDLAGKHGLSQEDLKDWSSLRVILASYGWLARRVGDYTVPPSYVIFAVVRPEEAGAGVNELGLLGVPGIAPFRATRLTERWGKSWSNRFRKVEWASMAETRERMEELLKGIQERPLPEEAV